MLARFYLGVLFATLSFFALLPQAIRAQSIVSVPDRTGTIVQQNGEIYTITGGTRSGFNLFHSFQEFGLTPNEIADFISNPEINNILGRVVGGNPSIVEGLIRLSGGDSNLYLVNEAGWIFTRGAKLDVPGSFGVSTANRIGFENGFFNASGMNDYETLIGNPTGLFFDTMHPGIIINGGDLAVKAGENIYAIAGSVFSTGTFSAPGGNITIAAIPGHNQVKITQEGTILSIILDVKPVQPGEREITGLKLSDIPRYLMEQSETGLVTNEANIVRLANNNMPLPETIGTVIISGAIATVTRSPDLTPSIDIIGENIALLAANLDASGVNTGGNIRIGGDYRGQSSLSISDRTLISSDTIIQANALNFGDGGQVIIWSNDATRFHGEINVRGGQNIGNGGFVEVSGRNFLDFQGHVDTSASRGTFGTLLLDPTNIEIVANGNNTSDTTLSFNDTPLDAKLDVSFINNATANVILEATNNITFSSAIAMSTEGVGLQAYAQNGINVNANITTNNGFVNLNADADNSNGGELALNNAQISTGTGNITLVGRGKIGSNGGGTGGTGIALNNSSLATTSGNISLTGVGGDGGTGIDRPDGNAGGTGTNAKGGTGGDGVAATGTGGTSGAAGSHGGDGGVGIVVINSNLTSLNGEIHLTGNGGKGGNGGNGGGGGGGARNRTATTGEPGFGGRSGSTSNGGDGGNGPASGGTGGNGGSQNNPGQGGNFSHAGGGGGGGGLGGISGGIGSTTNDRGTSGIAGSSGGSGGGGSAFNGANIAGGGGGGSAGFGGGGGGASSGGIGGNGGNGGGIDGGNGGNSGQGGTTGGMGTGQGGNGSNAGVNQDGNSGTVAQGGDGGIAGGQRGGGGGGAGGNGGDGGDGGNGITLISGQIFTSPGHLTLSGTGGSGGSGGNGGGGGGGGRGVGAGGGGGGGAGGNGGTGGLGWSIAGDFQILSGFTDSKINSVVVLKNSAVTLTATEIANLSITLSNPEMCFSSLPFLVPEENREDYEARSGQSCFSLFESF